MIPGSKSNFRTVEGKSVAVTIILASSLFFLWLLCINLMGKQLQQEFHLALALSWWVIALDIFSQPCEQVGWRQSWVMHDHIRGFSEKVGVRFQ